ncbi:ribosome-inactivating protein [Xylariaceae sp. AK1471]|nr:ribosome-inactivating protein [Xylariaceae sp. AK1471]
MGDQTPTYNIRNNALDYESFIKELRRTLANPGSFARGLPVLLEQNDGRANNLIEIVLRTDSQAVRLSLRRDNLYLIGFRNEATGNPGPWYEINSDRQRIPGSTPVGFTGDYGALERTAGIGDETRLDLALGYGPLTNAVNQLATVRNPSNTNNREPTARSLLVIIQMISESIRIQWISDYLTRIWTSGGIDPVQHGRMIEFETAWGTLSEALIHADQDPDPSHFRLPQGNALGITNAAGVIAVLGILLHRVLPSTSGSSRSGRAIMAPWADYPRGRALVEVFWVRIERIDDENPGDLYGTIKAADALGSQDLYNRDRSHYESIRPGQHASLTGPSRCILASDSFTIDLNLWDKDSDASPDDNIIQEKIQWNLFDARNTFDRTTTQRVDGKYGWATVHYIVLSNAAQALIEVVLINGDGENPADVYGTITARNGFGDTELFNKASGDYIDVRPGAAIPLRRSVVAVPLSQQLQIDASVYDHDSDWSPDDEIARGTVNFNVDIMKSASKSIRGAYGEISVRVSWF